MSEAFSTAKDLITSLLPKSFRGTSSRRYTTPNGKRQKLSNDTSEDDQDNKPAALQDDDEEPGNPTRNLADAFEEINKQKENQRPETVHDNPASGALADSESARAPPALADYSAGAAAAVPDASLVPDPSFVPDTLLHQKDAAGDGGYLLDQVRDKMVSKSRPSASTPSSASSTSAYVLSSRSRRQGTKRSKENISLSMASPASSNSKAFVKGRKFVKAKRPVPENDASAAVASNDQDSDAAAASSNNQDSSGQDGSGAAAAVPKSREDGSGLAAAAKTGKSTGEDDDDAPMRELEEVREDGALDSLDLSKSPDMYMSDSSKENESKKDSSQDDSGSSSLFGESYVSSPPTGMAKLGEPICFDFSPPAVPDARLSAAFRGVEAEWQKEDSLHPGDRAHASEPGSEPREKDESSRNEDLECTGKHDREIDEEDDNPASKSRRLELEEQLEASDLSDLSPGRRSSVSTLLPSLSFLNITKDDRTMAEEDVRRLFKSLEEGSGKKAASTSRVGDLEVLGDDQDDTEVKAEIRRLRDAKEDAKEANKSLEDSAAVEEDGKTRDESATPEKTDKCPCGFKDICICDLDSIASNTESQDANKDLEDDTEVETLRVEGTSPSRTEVESEKETLEESDEDVSKDDDEDMESSNDNPEKMDGDLVEGAKDGDSDEVLAEAPAENTDNGESEKESEDAAVKPPTASNDDDEKEIDDESEKHNLASNFEKTSKGDDLEPAKESGNDESEKDTLATAGGTRDESATPEKMNTENSESAKESDWAASKDDDDEESDGKKAADPKDKAAEGEKDAAVKPPTTSADRASDEDNGEKAVEDAHAEESAKGKDADQDEEMKDAADDNADPKDAEPKDAEEQNESEKDMEPAKESAKTGDDESEKDALAEMEESTPDKTAPEDDGKKASASDDAATTKELEDDLEADPKDPKEDDKPPAVAKESDEALEIDEMMEDANKDDEALTMVKESVVADPKDVEEQTESATAEGTADDDDEEEDAVDTRKKTAPAAKPPTAGMLALVDYRSDDEKMTADEQTAHQRRRHAEKWDAMLVEQHERQAREIRMISGAGVLQKTLSVNKTEVEAMKAACKIVDKAEPKDYGASCRRYFHDDKFKKLMAPGKKQYKKLKGKGKKTMWEIRHYVLKDAEDPTTVELVTEKASDLFVQFSLTPRAYDILCKTPPKEARGWKEIHDKTFFRLYVDSLMLTKSRPFLLENEVEMQNEETEETVVFKGNHAFYKAFFENDDVVGAVAEMKRKIQRRRDRQNPYFDVHTLKPGCADANMEDEFEYASPEVSLEYVQEKNSRTCLPSSAASVFHLMAVEAEELKNKSLTKKQKKQQQKEAKILQKKLDKKKRKKDNKKKKKCQNPCEELEPLPEPKPEDLVSTLYQRLVEAYDDNETRVYIHACKKIINETMGVQQRDFSASELPQYNPFDGNDPYKGNPVLVGLTGEDSKSCSHCVVLYKGLLFEPSAKIAMKLTKENLQKIGGQGIAWASEFGKNLTPRPED